MSEPTLVTIKGVSNVHHRQRTGGATTVGRSASAVSDLLGFETAE